MPWIGGLDPGKTVDPAALVCLEQVEGTDPLAPSRPCWHYSCRYLRTWPLGTPYTTVGGQLGLGEQVRDIFAREPLRGCQVAVDQTGVGGPVLDILRGLNPSCCLVGILQTGGHASRRVGLDWHVSKAELVSLLVSVLHGGRLKVATRLPQAPTLQQQLAAFREKQTARGNLTWEAEGANHDDLVMALATAVWLGERAPPLRRGDIGVGRRVVSRMPAGVFLPGKMPKRW